MRKIASLVPQGSEKTCDSRKTFVFGDRSDRGMIADWPRTMRETDPK